MLLHRFGRGRVLLLAVLLLMLAACAPGQHKPSVQAPSAGLASIQSARNLFGQLLAHARDLGPVSGNQAVSFLVLLRDPTARQQAAALNAIYDPHSPHFGHFSSLQQWQTAYGPPASRVQQARALLRRLGVDTSWQRGDTWLVVHGRADRIERVFRVRIDRFLSARGTHFWASRRDPALPSWLRTVAAGAGHLSSYRSRTTLQVPANGLTPTGLLTAYDMTPLRQAGMDGTGQTVAFIETDGFRQSDFDAFTDKFHLPRMQPRIKFGGRMGDIAGEAEMDMEVVHEIAPGATLTVYNCGNPCDSTGIAEAEARAARGTAHGIISISLGGCEGAEAPSDIQAEKSAFDQADALGESVFVASGDSGAFTCLDQDWGADPTQKYIGVSSPAVIPGVTGVGGTRLSVNRNGSWYREESWEVPPQTAGTGGGVSVYFHRPSWQQGPGVVNQYDTNDMREVPDVSADADVLTAAQVNVDGQFNQVGGTSQAAPIWAGMTALINQYLQKQGSHAAGFLNPALYTLAAQKQQFPPFHDVTLGTNLVYPATPGYDLATGLGSPDAWNLTRDLLAYQKGGGR